MITKNNLRCFAVFLTVFCSLSQFTVAAESPVTSAQDKTIRVGPNRPVKTISGASALVSEGGIIEVDAGEYRNDVAIWTQKTLTLRAIGGRVKIIATGAAAEGKGIWIVRGGKIEVDGFDFTGAAVADHNGAGIRFEKGHLIVRNSSFMNNENGILTSNDKDSVLEIENCEFGHNGFGDGQSHNVYIGTIKRLSVTGSYFHHARVGHLLKSRAAENFIFYNRLTDEIGGRASYELEFPAGGIAYVVGNVIQQGSQTENPHMIAYGAEGYVWPSNELYLINNTLIDNRPNNGIFLKVKPGKVVIRAINNLLAGKGKLEAAGPGEYQNNLNVDWGDFVLAQREDYRLNSSSKLIGKAIDPGSVNNVDFRPKKEYSHPSQTQSAKPSPFNPGAMQTIGDAR
jgi:hypothetical protein